MGQIWHELTSRRPQEKTIGYAESHDQALVGDITLMFRLTGKEMYTSMAKGKNNLIVNRAMDLHKLIRLVTLTLAGEGYLNFMGNEFGHPEWIDFPRAENDWSFKHARRQWSLAGNGYLTYKYLYRFDKEMVKLVKSYQILSDAKAQNLWTDETKKILAYKKGGFVFLFNFNPTTSFTDFALPIHESGNYKVIFNSDDRFFGGAGRIDESVVYSSKKLSGSGNSMGITIYTPSRSAVVLKKI